MATFLPTVAVYAAATFGLLIAGGIVFRLQEAAIHERTLALPGEMKGCQGLFVRRAQGFI